MCLLIGFGWEADAGPEHYHLPPAAVAIGPPSARHAEQPHPPGVEGTQPVRAIVAEVRRGSFILGDPVRGRLDGPYVLG